MPNARSCAVLLLAVGCQSSSHAPDGAPVGDGRPPDTAGGGQLTIVSLTLTAPTITGGAPDATETDRETFVAIVTDSAGLADIAGGELLDDLGRTYAAFSVGATNSTFTTTVTYAQINQVDPIEFVSTGSRTFVAKFFSNGGSTATMPLAVMLACRTNDGLVGSCAGACTDLMESGDTCGGCHHACTAGQVCGDGTCNQPVVVGGFSECVAVGASIAGATCNDVCARAQLICNPQDSLNGLLPYDTCAFSTSPSLGCTHPIGSAGTAFFRCGCTP